MSAPRQPILLLRAVSFASISAALLSAGCGREKLNLGRPDVVLIVVDTLRNDEMPWMGGDARVAPNLGRRPRVGDARS